MMAPFKTTTSVGQNIQVFSWTDASLGSYHKLLLCTWQDHLTDSLLGGDVVSVTVVLNGPVTPVLVTAAT